jgi:mono/diheme cytochrome c family protein
MLRGLWAGMAVALLLARAAGAQEQGDARKGREMFEQNCAMCHGSDASGMMGMHPSLRGAIERLSREGVEVTIRQGRDVQPPMPAFQGRLSDEDISDVIAYLDTLPVGPRNFGPGAGMGDMVRSGTGASNWFPWILVGILALALIAVLVVSSMAVRRARRSQALEILAERYARRGDQR